MNPLRPLCLFLLLVAILNGPVRALEEHRGFAFDDSAVEAGGRIAEVREVMKAQIDLVLAVGLPEEVVAFFRGVPLSVHPAGVFRSPTPGRYLPAKREVQLVENFVRFRTKPILLHELMHAYHHEKLPEGMKNETVLGFFEKAKTLGAYDSESHMMANVGEYFACTTTAYLHGATAQEPFSRDKLREKQPVYFKFLAGLFGPDAGKHDGTL